MKRVRASVRAALRRSLRLVACLAPLLLAACQVDLYSGLSEREANEMLAILIRADIDARRMVAKDGTSTVRVEEAAIAPAVEVLAARGYPRHRHVSMADVFAGDGFIQSQTEEHARFIYAMGEELSRTISEIDGVISARVHVVLPRADPLRGSATPSSASVFIRHEEARPVAALLPQIKLLIANSIEGLAYDKVAVIFVPVAIPEPEPAVQKARAPLSAPGERTFAVAGLSPMPSDFLVSIVAALAGLGLILAACWRLFDRPGGAGRG